MKPGVNDSAEPTAAGLITVLGRLEGLHGQLAQLIDQKIDRMKRADVEGINACTSREHELVGKIGEQESLRRLLTERLTRAYGMSPRKARTAVGGTVTQLAEKLASPQREQLLDVAGRLSGLANRIARRNRVAGMLGTEMLRHLSGVLCSAAGGGRDVAYSPRGCAEGGAARRLFETVG